MARRMYGTRRAVPRGLLFGESLTEALPWILRALLFDVRRGAHSVGSNVRDAACRRVGAGPLK